MQKTNFLLLKKLKNNESFSFFLWQDPSQELDLFFELGLDGYFTDYPLTLANFLEAKMCKKNWRWCVQK